MKINLGSEILTKIESVRINNQSIVQFDLEKDTSHREADDYIQLYIAHNLIFTIEDEHQHRQSFLRMKYIEVKHIDALINQLNQIKELLKEVKNEDI